MYSSFLFSVLLKKIKGKKKKKKQQSKKKISKFKKKTKSTGNDATPTA